MKINHSLIVHVSLQNMVYVKRIGLLSCIISFFAVFG